VEVGASQTYESYNTLRTKIDVGSSFKKFTVRADGSRQSSDGFGGNGAGVYAARYADYGAGAKLSYKPTEKSDINILGRYFLHETFNPERSMNIKHPLTQNITIGANGGFLSLNDKNNFRISINFDKYFDYDVMERMDNEHKLKNTALYLSSRAINTFTPTKKWEITSGVEYNHEENFATTTLGSQPTTKRNDDMNLFAQVEYKPFKNFDIVGGARYTYNLQFGSAFTPKLSLMYNIVGIKIRAGIGTAFRAPSIKELYYDFDHQGMFWVYGNPDLKPEKGLYVPFSVEYTKGKFNVSAAGYYNHINSKITQYDIINKVGGKEKYYKNVSSATLAGFDFNIDYTFSFGLHLKGSYSYCDAKDNATGLQLESNVKHSGTTSVTWNCNIWKNPYSIFSIQFAGRVNSPVLFQQIVADESGEQYTELNQSKTYSIWKIVAVKPFYFKGGHVLELTFKVDNIFDFKDDSFINPGRQYMIGLRYNFKTQIKSKK
jgi:outer membrane receptor for ferrienterochelin and colicins